MNQTPGTPVADDPAARVDPQRPPAARWADLAFRSFHTRIVVSFLALITLVQVAAFVAVDSAITRSARVADRAGGGRLSQ